MPAIESEQKYAAIEEYKEAGANLRHYGNMRFAQLTLLAAVSGGLFTALISKDPCLTESQKILLACLGLLFSGALWVMEERSNQWWQRFFSRAIALEKEIGANQFTPPQQGCLSATVAVHIVYLVLVLVWLTILAMTVYQIGCHPKQSVGHSSSTSQTGNSAAEIPKHP